MMKRMANRFQNLKLNQKLALLIVVAGFLPLGVVFLCSMNQLQRAYWDRQLYTLNKGYEQVVSSVNDRLVRVHNVSMLLAIDETVNRTLKMDARETGAVDQLSMFDQLSSYAYAMEFSFNEGGILFYVKDSFVVANSQSTRFRPLSAAANSLWYHELKANRGKPTWTDFDEQSIALARTLWDEDDFTKEIGVLAVLVDKAYLASVLMNADESQAMYLLLQSGDVLLGNAASDRLPMDIRNGNGADFAETVIDGEAFLARCSALPDVQLYLVSMIEKAKINEQINQTLVQSSLIYVVICLAAVLLTVPLTKFILRRIRLLHDKMKLVQDGIIEKVLDSGDYKDEVGELTTNYNFMIQKVEALMEEQFTLGQEKIGADLKALQSQINPHFLYNTLDMIGWMAQKGETQNVLSMLQAMSAFYRLTLSKGKDIVTIKDEIDLCKAYMEIQRKRQKGRVSFKDETIEEIYPYAIPKITLQPFIENAIIHGISEKSDRRGVITLDGYINEGRIVLRVMDDGQGMVLSDAVRASGGSHYGIFNIEKRLTLFFGEPIQARIESSPGIGTSVTVSIPLRRMASEEST